MRFPLYGIFLLLMLLGNSFALYKLFTDKQGYITKFPMLTETAFNVFRFLPLLNIIALAGMWYLKFWGAYLAIACGIAVIVFDVYFRIYYHLYVAVPATLMLLFFVIKYRNHFE